MNRSIERRVARWTEGAARDREALELPEVALARPGHYDVLMSLGPGFCGEIVLVRW